MRSNNSLRRNGKYRRSMRQILGFNFYDVFVFLFCIVFALVCVYPMWYVLVASVTPYEEYIKGGLMLWPTGRCGPAVLQMRSSVPKALPTACGSQ